MGRARLDPARGPARDPAPVRSALLVLLVLAGGGAAEAQGPALPEAGGPARVALSAMTFNIRTSEGRDGANAWSNRRELVAETIRARAPDVLGLQEALADQITFLEDALPEYRWIGVDRGLNGGTGLSEATPIFYRHRDLAPIESGTFWLSDDPDGPSPGRWAGRIVTWARFRHLASGRDVYVYNTHLSLRRGPSQAESVGRVVARIADLAPDDPVIMTGDFNATAERTETWDVATSGGLRDAWAEAEERRGPSVTWSGFAPATPGVDDRIDWILVGGNARVLVMETLAEPMDGRFPSDHFPVFGRFEFD